MNEDSQPIICFGQQPCGFFPRRFLYAKFATARRLQREIGGKLVFFYHDADHDPRETQTTLYHLKTGQAQTLNFSFKNKIQRKYSPLYQKTLVDGWKDDMQRQLPNYVNTAAQAAFRRAEGDNIADFCLSIYLEMGLLEGIDIVRSSSPAVREAAMEVDAYFVDTPWEGEVVRARYFDGQPLRLHAGGPKWIDLPPTTFTKAAISPTRDSRLRWMQSVVNCTHYIAGAGEMAYLNMSETPAINFVARDSINDSNSAYVDCAD